MIGPPAPKPQKYSNRPQLRSEELRVESEELTAKGKSKRAKERRSPSLLPPLSFLFPFPSSLFPAFPTFHSSLFRSPRFARAPSLVHTVDAARYFGDTRPSVPRRPARVAPPHPRHRTATPDDVRRDAGVRRVLRADRVRFVVAGVRAARFMAAAPEARLARGAAAGAGGVADPGRAVHLGPRARRGDPARQPRRIRARAGHRAGEPAPARRPRALQFRPQPAGRRP